MNKIIIWIKNLSLKQKWALTSTFVLFISYAIICTVIFFSLKTWLIYNEEVTANRTMDDLLVLFESADRNLTIQAIQRNSGLINEIIEKDQTVRIYNADGVEVLRINDSIHVFPITIERNMDRKIEHQKVGDVKILIASEPVQIGLFRGYLQLAHPLTPVYAMLHYILTAMVIAGIGALLLSSFIGYGLATFLIRPLEQLGDSMRKVKNEGFDAPINFSYSSNDEIGALLQVYHAMMRELQMSFAQQQQFISDASHELRTPIQALEGHLSMLTRWGKDDPEILNESLATSLSEIQRMKKLIEELLELAKRENVALMNVSASLYEVYIDIKNELLTIYPEVQMDCHLGKKIYVLSISESALGQILRNIFENAIKYCNTRPLIHVNVVTKGDFAEISIQDNGIGIANNNLPFIFDRFYRVDEVRNRESGGTGLGLSITKLLVEKYGGTIEVNSILGQGSEFIVKLPIKN